MPGQNMYFKGMSKLQTVIDKWVPYSEIEGIVTGYNIDCPGCGKKHFLRTRNRYGENYPTWGIQWRYGKSLIHAIGKINDR